MSDETGRDEVWVRGFPDGDTAIRVSDGGGTEPIWAPDGRSLHYRNETGTRVFSLPVTPEAVPQFGAATTTSGCWVRESPYGRMYDVAPDGALLMITDVTLGRELGVVLNFDELIRRKMAEGK